MKEGINDDGRKDPICQAYEAKLEKGENGLGYHVHCFCDLIRGCRVAAYLVDLPLQPYDKHGAIYLSAPVFPHRVEVF
jgi:hypothetical protein